MKKIFEEDMFSSLLEVLPAFTPQWEAFVAHWTPEPGKEDSIRTGRLPQYLLLGDLAKYLCDLLEAGETEDVAKALAVAERWITEGEHYVHEAAIVGLLEDMQNVCQRRKIPEENFLALMGPEGQFWWAKLNGFWNKTDTLEDERKFQPVKDGTLKP